MSGRTEIERALDGFLAEGPERVADPALTRALDAIDRTNQRRGLLAPWRFLPMNTSFRIAAAAVVAVIAVGGALYFIGPRNGVGNPTSAPSPTTAAQIATPAPTTIALPDPTLPLDTTTWLRYTGSRYGYSLADPSGWMTSPASEDWAGQTSYEMWASTADAPWADKTFSSTWGITMTALAATIPAGVSEDAFIATYLAPPSGPTPTCFAIPANPTSIVIDGHPARRTTNCGDQTTAISAFVAVGRRMFVFGVSDANRLAVFDAFLSTIDLPNEAPSAT